MHYVCRQIRGVVDSIGLADEDTYKIQMTVQAIKPLIVVMPRQFWTHVWSLRAALGKVRYRNVLYVVCFVQ